MPLKKYEKISLVDNFQKARKPVQPDIHVIIEYAS